jgi:hypothetical protein
VRDQLAVRLAESADPRALAVLQSPTVDQRVAAALSVLAATEPVPVQDIPAISTEDSVGTPRREFTLAADGDTRERLAGFFRSQVGSFAPESVTMTPTGLRVRLPYRAKEIGLGGWTPPQDGPAALRVADLRNERGGERLNLVRVDGTVAGSMPMNTDESPSEYRAVPAGTYIVTTQGVGKAPVIRQVITVNAGASYTFALFSRTETGDSVTQLVPDGQGAGAGGSVRLIEAASAANPVGLSVTSDNASNPTVLADGVTYGLVSGYAPLPAGEYTAAVTANGGQWHQPFSLDAGKPTSLLLTDGPDGPALRTVSDVPQAPRALDPATLTLPDDPDSAHATPPRPAPTASPLNGWAVALVAVFVCSLCVIAAGRLERRP